MQTRFYIISGLAVIVSFAGGFLLANSLNRAEIVALQANQVQSNNAVPAPAQSARDAELSDREIEQKLAEAERNATDFAFQKGLGLGLYRYAAFKKDRERLKDVETLLNRAHSLNPDDYQVLVAFANVNFDLGQINSDEKLNQKARELYRAALRKNPKDAQVLGDMGTTYIETGSPDARTALGFLERSYASDSRNEKVVIELIKAHKLIGNSDRAGEFILKLKELNPKNPEIGRLEAELETGGGK
ncbi:MAG: hypothetical protein OEQ28_03765 [Acidobacteriota bacterium]|nr:hypothetical protein [Acidobacteriota bacterium]